MRKSQKFQDRVLPITLDPSPEASFKEALLRSKQAYFTVSFRDRIPEIREWKAERFASTSGVMHNIRSQHQFRRSNTEKEGIVSVHVTIKHPATRNL